MNRLIELTNETIDIARLLSAVASPSAGGEVLFVGTTRQFTNEQRIAASDINSSVDNSSQNCPKVTSYLVYEAYAEMALQQLHQLADQARQRWALEGLAIVHRLGQVLPMEASVAIAVSSPHRAEAFAAARWLIDTIKVDVAIWKQENYQDETAQWIHPPINHLDQSPDCRAAQARSAIGEADQPHRAQS
jgi:molybdopterin synthase catalytic subunit